MAVKIKEEIDKDIESEKKIAADSSRNLVLLALI